MPIPFQCSRCNAAYEVADELAGKEVMCRKCECRSLVVDYTGAHVSFVCPQCKEQTEVPASLAGRWLRCPNCQKLAKVPSLSRQARPSRRTILLASGGVLLLGTMAIGLFWARGDKPKEGASEETPGRRMRDKSQPQQGGRAPGQPGRRNRKRGNQNPV